MAQRSDLKVAVIGAGAVGAYYGAMLARAGHEVHFLFRSDLATVHKRGIAIKSVNGDFTLAPHEVRAHGRVRDMPKVDVILLALKATSNDQFKSLLGPVVGDETAIVCMQNGLGNEEQLGELFGAERILGGMAFICSNRLEAGVIQHLGFGQVRLGEFVGGPNSRTQRIAQMFLDSGVPCEVLANLRAGRWEKLVWNIPFNGLGAALDQTTEQVIATPEGEAHVRQIMAEVIATARAAYDIRMPDDLIERQIIKTRTMGDYKTSMQIDRQMRRPMEIEAIIAVPLRIAREHGVSVPRWEALHAALSVAAR